MVAPAQAKWVAQSWVRGLKKGTNLPWLWIKLAHVGTFVLIAPQARPRQVLQMTLATVLSRHNVIRLVCVESKPLR